MKSITIVAKYTCCVGDNIDASQIQEEMRERLEDDANWFVVEISEERYEVDLEDVSAGTSVVVMVGGE